MKYTSINTQELVPHWTLIEFNLYNVIVIVKIDNAGVLGFYKTFFPWCV